MQIRGSIVELLKLLALSFALAIPSQSDTARAGSWPATIVRSQLQSKQTSTLEISSRPRLARDQAMEIRSQGRYAQVTITVTGPSGGYISNLTQRQLRVFEDGTAWPIIDCQQDAHTLATVGIIIDVWTIAPCSPSLTGCSPRPQPPCSTPLGKGCGWSSRDATPKRPCW